LKILVLDNYDSFTYNLVHLIEKVCIEAKVTVFKNDVITLKEIELYDKLILSPGPGLPKDAGLMPLLLKTYANTKPIFGVCLGLQAIAQNYGAELKNLSQVYHGIATEICVNKNNFLFKNCPEKFKVGRYHSWVVDKINLPKELKIVAEDAQGNIMALQHQNHNVCGVQFHPESILSEFGEVILSNWIYNS